MSILLTKIAEMIGAEGHFPEKKIRDINKIEDAGSEEIAFLHNPKYFNQINTTRAGAVIAPKDISCNRDIPILKVDDPYGAFLKVLVEFHPVLPTVEKGIDKNVSLGKEVKIGKDPSIGPFVSVGANSVIGDNVQIHSGASISANVTIGNNVIIYSNVSVREKCVIGNNVIIQPGAVIGSDGFGFAPNQSAYDKIPQVGNVIIEDDVEIGANTCIDRATLGSTIVRRGAKLDNLMQIAHNVDIGQNTAMAAQTGISGSTSIGDNCMVGGQVGFVGHIKIGSGVMIGAQAGVSKDLKDGSVVTGTPCREISKQRKIDASLSRLPDIIYKIRDVEKKIKDLTKK
ncbi:MAG: UDP-3-O-(3-hydroxymyristoyl)glucosamine N-acyltransferase [Candidatus Delongbacteria bacterium]